MKSVFNVQRLGFNERTIGDGPVVANPRIIDVTGDVTSHKNRIHGHHMSIEIICPLPF